MGSAQRKEPKGKPGTPLPKEPEIEGLKMEKGQLKGHFRSNIFDCKGESGYFLFHLAASFLWGTQTNLGVSRFPHGKKKKNL